MSFLQFYDVRPFRFDHVQPSPIGIQNLLTVAGTVPEHKVLPITPNTRMQTSLCLSKIYDDLIGDKERDKYRNAAEEYFK